MVSIWTSLIFCRLITIHSLPDVTIQDFFETNLAIVDNKSNMKWRVRSITQKSRKHCETRNKYKLKHFFLLPHCLKDSPSKGCRNKGLCGELRLACFAFFLKSANSLNIVFFLSFLEMETCQEVQILLWSVNPFPHNETF